MSVEPVDPFKSFFQLPVINDGQATPSQDVTQGDKIDLMQVAKSLIINNNNSELQNSVSAVAVSVQVGQSATMTVESKEVSEEEAKVIREEQAEIEKRLTSMQTALTVWPSWVRQSYVARIRELKCFEAIRESILHGIPAIIVANQVHSLGELTDMSSETVRQYLEHYRATIPKGQLLATQMPGAAIKAQEVVNKVVDEVEGLSKLISQMHERLEMGLVKEKQIGFLMAEVGKQYENAADMYEKLSEIKERVFGSGDSIKKIAQSRSPAVLKQVDKIYQSEAVSRVLADPASRMRIVKTIEGVVGMLGGQSKEMTDEVQRELKRQSGDKLDPDGTR